MKHAFSVLFVASAIVACAGASSANTVEANDTIKEESNVVEEVTPSTDFRIDTSGMTIRTRFCCTADGFVRPNVKAGSWADYLLNLPLHPADYPCHYYYGGTKEWSFTAAVINMDIDNEDIQQCADAVMRLRGEYLYSTKQYDKLHFNFTNGFRCDFVSWAEGKRVGIQGNKTWWNENAAPRDYSYSNFRKWMRMVFYYAGSYSLSRELKPVSLPNLQIGDVLIIGGTPGHAELVVDMYKNSTTGDVRIMLAQSYMPAQEIEIIYNSDYSPWYTITPNDTDVNTTSYYFSTSNFMRFAE
ncbi:MAG: DUF4846 domain-containing protein [Marinilabiliaceae bacterium]|nr:DUF4846 domain-containing protein [Marinilabiliaceae bacterium]